MQTSGTFVVQAQRTFRAYPDASTDPAVRENQFFAYLCGQADAALKTRQITLGTYKSVMNWAETKITANKCREQSHGK